MCLFAATSIKKKNPNKQKKTNAQTPLYSRKQVNGNAFNIALLVSILLTVDARDACSHCRATACSCSMGVAQCCMGTASSVQQPAGLYFHPSPSGGGGAVAEGVNVGAQGMFPVIWWGWKGLPGCAGSSPAARDDAPCGTLLQVAQERRIQRARKEGRWQVTRSK